MVFNKELSIAWQIINNTDTHLFLTGKAGTGKTTFLKELRRQSMKRMVVLAPTGIAAINAQGSTIHSFFQIMRLHASKKLLQNQKLAKFTRALFPASKILVYS